MELIDLQMYLAVSAAKHTHLCPRQVLGVRLALAGVNALGLAAPAGDKRLMAIVETDGCFSDGVSAVTGSSVSHRTLRVVDFGKVAVTLVDTVTEVAFRVSPQIDVRERVGMYAPGENRPYFAQLTAYQSMPDDELLDLRPVELDPDVKSLVSQAGMRAACEKCGEEILNERQVIQNGMVLCQACAGFAYYRTPAK
jgi:formylmethanofuran dehydrogenase subunit E